MTWIFLRKILSLQLKNLYWKEGISDAFFLRSLIYSSKKRQIQATNQRFSGNNYPFYQSYCRTNQRFQKKTTTCFCCLKSPYHRLDNIHKKLIRAREKYFKNYKNMVTGTASTFFWVIFKMFQIRSSNDMGKNWVVDVS